MWADLQEGILLEFVDAAGAYNDPLADDTVLRAQYKFVCARANAKWRVKKKLTDPGYFVALAAKRRAARRAA